MVPNTFLSSLVGPPSDQSLLPSDTGRQSLRGLTMGCVHARVPLTVYIVGDATLGWLLLLYEQRLQLRGVYFHQASLVELLRDLLPPTCVVYDNWDSFAQAVEDTTGTHLLLVDGGWAGRYRRLLQSGTIGGVILTKGLRRSIPGWYHQSVTVPHIDLGGVTNSVRVFTFITWKQLPVFCLPSQPVPRDVSTVLEDAPTGVGRAALSGEIDPLQVVYVSPTEIHGRGLVPWPLPRGIQVRTPCLYARTGQWVCRRFTWHERLAILDIPLGLSTFIPSSCGMLMTHQTPLDFYRWALDQWETGGVVFLRLLRNRPRTESNWREM